jgi:small subunit ribosomal protein S16
MLAAETPPLPKPGSSPSEIIEWNIKTSARKMASSSLPETFCRALLPKLRHRQLPFPLTSGIIRVCLHLAGLFRNKDIPLVLMIRLARVGARKQPHYRIVVIEKERARNGRPVEVVGTYNPRTNPASVELKRERVDYWVSKGAQMSDRVHKLFSKPAAAPTAAPAA